ncbi:unnamed protein product [Withania somnifera]
MTQMGRQSWWPRLTTSRAMTVDTLYDGGRSNITTRSFSTSTSSSLSSSSSSSSSCCGLSRLLRKLKRHSNKMLKTAAISTSRQSSFQCRYDPLSYALNFDTSNHVSDEDYYKFCAFSSRFVAIPKGDDHCQNLMPSRTAASH